ncbi:hypothetical protein TWF281_004255 [Arthrobotrys megalospora]
MILLHFRLAPFLLLLAGYPLVSTSPAILPRAQDQKHSLQFGNPITISASLSLGIPPPPPKGPPSVVPPPPSSSISISPSIFSSSSPPRSNDNQDQNGDKDEKDTATSVLWLPHSTDPHITHTPKSTWIQDDYPPQPPTNTSLPLLHPTSLPADDGASSSFNLTCHTSYPSPQSLKICNPKLLIPIFLIFYIAILRIVLHLQHLSAKQVLNLGEVLARHRDSYKGYAWFSGGSWKIRQQPELPAVAMLSINDMERITFGDVDDEGDEREGRSRRNEGYGTMRDERLARPERIYLEDLDYRRKKWRVGNNTPERGSVKGKGKARLTRREEELRQISNEDLVPVGSNEEEEEEEVQIETQQEYPTTTTTEVPSKREKKLTPYQQKELEEKRQEMVRRTHVRMLNDTKSKRVVYGALAVFWSVGVAFMVFGILLMIVCKQIWKIGKCPFEGV